MLVSYSNAQQQDQVKYDALGSTNALQADSFPMNNRSSQPWDNRPRADQYNDKGFAHHRQDSTTSMSDVMTQPVHQPKDSYYYSEEPQTYPPQGYHARQALGPSQPSQAYTADPGPTPQYSDTMYSGPSSSLDRPAYAQAHPGES